MYLICLGSKYIHEDKVSYFKGLLEEKKTCNPSPMFDDDSIEEEVSMGIEEDFKMNDDCFSEDTNSQRLAEIDYKMAKAEQRKAKIDPNPQVS